MTSFIITEIKPEKIKELEKILSANWFDDKFLTDDQIRETEKFTGNINLEIINNIIQKFVTRTNSNIIISHNAYVRKNKLKKLI